MHPSKFSLRNRPEHRVGIHSILRLFCLIGLSVFLSFACGSSKDKQEETAVSEERIVAEAVEVLSHGNIVERDSVTRILYNIRNASLLLDYLNDPNYDVKIGMVSALGYIKDRVAAQPLSELLLSEKNYILLETIIMALGEIRDTSSVSLLIGVLEDETVDRRLHLSLPITLAAFAQTPAAGRIEDTFVQVLEKKADDIELCAYVAVGILEIINPDNYHRFRKYLPALREMAGKRKAEFGEDGIWTHIYLTIEELESYEPPAS